ncbi:alpha/beta hydrolase [Heyndrickxia oleronia]|uniref:alpha/beta fold hydrolase n=1 Tax=Heyndrickxia oleronia TaxID=38875 RepID=UPI00203D1F31|nr:alpha/beta hydrolase [Heyndrickxia oleronia]MCM3236685.1 alpha/beta hydrolase [Heyndrickxia oleronia]
MPFVKCVNRSIFYEDLGQGPTILFVHPPGMGRKTFIKQKLLQSSYRLLIPDFSGHGDSYSIDGKMNISLYVEEIEAIRNQIGEEAIFLFGYSAGGTIVQEYAIKYPKNVKGVILSGGYPKVTTELLRIEHQIGINMVVYAPKMLAKLLSLSHYREASLQAELYQHILKSNRYTWRQFYIESLRFNCVDRIAQLNAPLMLLYSTKTDYINHHIKYYSKFIDTEIHLIKGSGHQLPTRRFEKVNKLIEQFIQKH